MGVGVPRRFTRPRLSAGVAVAGLLALAGCNVLSGPPPETYNLSPADVPGGGRATSAQILVPESTAIAALDSERVVVMTGTLLSYYPEAQWPDKLPRLLQAKFIEAFQRSGKARAAGRPGQGLSIDYQLLTDIRAFQFDTLAVPPSAHIEIAVQIMNDRNGRIVATRVFTGDVPVPENTPGGVTAALDAAFQQVLADVVRWTASRI